MRGPYLRGPLRLEGPRRSPTHAPTDPLIPSPPQSREDPKDSGSRGRASPQPTAAVEKAENHHDDSTTHKASLLPTTTMSPRPPKTTPTTPSGIATPQLHTQLRKSRKYIQPKATAPHIFNCLHKTKHRLVEDSNNSFRPTGNSRRQPDCIG